jgi:hypothetical protein
MHELSFPDLAHFQPKLLTVPELRDIVKEKDSIYSYIAKKQKQKQTVRRRENETE